MSSLLGVTVLDYSSRLPGPLASSILKDFGASVTKIELKEDPFSSNEDELFFDWYKNINKDKAILKSSTVTAADIVIVPNKKIKELVKKEIKYKVLIQIGSTQKNLPMHDLNALAKSRAFKSIGNQELPFIPIMGVEFANKIALTSTSALYKNSLDNKSSEHIVYLEDIAQMSIDKLTPNEKEGSFLHNGKYPCYQIYQLKDGNKVAMASLEEHLWFEFAEAFKISLHTDDRFDTTGHTFNKIQKIFKSYSKEELNKKIYDNKLCLTII